MPYVHLTMDKRVQLYQLVQDQQSFTTMGRVIGCHRSTISRELKRLGQGKEYLPHKAQQHAQKQSMARSTPTLGNLTLMAEVRRRLVLDHSPEQIAGRLPIDYPAEPSMRISYESIYRWIYQHIRSGDKCLRNHLRHGRVRRRKRISSKTIRHGIKDRVSIDERPASVLSKVEAGHWEGDTITGTMHRGYIGTYVERTHKFLIAFPIQDKKSIYFSCKTKNAFKNIPVEFKKSITVDNGPEFAAHKKSHEEPVCLSTLLIPTTPGSVDLMNTPMV